MNFGSYRGNKRFTSAFSTMALSSGGGQTICSRQTNSNTDNGSMCALPEDCKPYQCGLCSLSFSVHTELVAHIQTHCLTRPYQCGYCKVGFESHTDLTSHVQSDHQGVQGGNSLPVVNSSNSVLAQKHEEASDQCSTWPTQHHTILENQETDTKAGMITDSEQFDGSIDDDGIDDSDEDGDDKFNNERKEESSDSAKPTSFKIILKENHTIRDRLGVQRKQLNISDSEEGDTNHVPGRAVKRKRGRPRKAKQDVVVKPVKKRRKRGPRQIIEGNYLDSHLDISDMLYQCGDCDALFKGPSLLRRHWEACHTACPVCKESFPNPQDLDDHLQAAHATEGKPYRPYLCGLCGTSFQVPKYVLHHIRKLHAERKLMNDAYLSDRDQKMFSCSVCPEKFVKQKQLLEHLRNVHKGHRHFQCAVCKQTFKDLSHMKRHHITTHLHIAWKPYKCEKCNERFEMYQHLKTHCEAFHSQGSSRPNQCSICGLSFKLEEALTRHVEACQALAESKKLSEPTIEDTEIKQEEAKKIKDDPDEKPKKKKKTKVVCYICGTMVLSLKSHIASQHLDLRPYKCSLCDQSLKTKWALENHLRVHNNEKPFTCEVCGRSFLKMKTLKYHRNTHTNARPYQCELCNRGFNSHSGLMVHRRRHLGDRRHTCNVCGMKFFASSNLQRHALTHTDLRPWSCKECGKTYRARSSLHYHMTHAHTGHS